MTEKCWEILEEFLADTYVKDQAVICVENIDQAKS